MPSVKIDAEPEAISIDPERTAVVIIDMQRDFLEPGGFGETIGKPITYVEITLEQAEAGMKSRNMPDWLVAHLVSIARAGGKGAFSKENTQPIRDIVGRAPITTKQFAQDFKGAFS